MPSARCGVSTSRTTPSDPGDSSMNPARPSSLDPVADHGLDLDLLGDELAELVAKISDELIEIRRDLHAHPELGRQETRTTTVSHRRRDKAGGRRSCRRSGGRS